MQEYFSSKPTRKFPITVVIAVAKNGSPMGTKGMLKMITPCEYAGVRNLRHESSQVCGNAKTGPRRLNLNCAGRLEITPRGSRGLDEVRRATRNSELVFEVA